MALRATEPDEDRGFRCYGVSSLESVFNGADEAGPEPINSLPAWTRSSACRTSRLSPLAERRILSQSLLLVGGKT